MQVLFFLGTAFVIFWVFGLSVVLFLQNTFPVSLFRTRAIRFTIPVIGYASVNIVWWIGTFLLRWSSDLVLYIWIAFAAASLFLCLRHRNPKRLLKTMLPEI